ncbi:hypothetical protein LEP1GSC165_3105 [Leptospira santarosai str. CBC523]|uniref:hypothetical protein n=1 Tax=Leptospira santarosai TaxID=28183 RepID=UPI0002BFF9F2|nr:hypothetical protein [Leptospira santarosai]EMO15955.1 hypothetical protein LEP1GSC165_3105 [Leptospira santarosai str. CBC523]
MSFLLPYQKNQLEELSETLSTDRVWKLSEALSTDRVWKLSEALSTDRVSGSVPKVAIHKEQLH